jgi:hypothetical protein
MVQRNIGRALTHMDSIRVIAGDSSSRKGPV